jgi:hypothetical protein
VVAWLEFVFWLAFICVIVTGIPEISRLQFSATTQIGVSLVLAVTLLGSDNFRAAVGDARGPARVWHRINSTRLAQRGGALELTEPAVYPSLAMHQQVTANSQCWVNRCMANYLKAESVVAKDSTEECPH